MGVMTSVVRCKWVGDTFDSLGVVTFRHDSMYDHEIRIMADMGHDLKTVPVADGGRARLVAVMEDGSRVRIPDGGDCAYSSDDAKPLHGDAGDVMRIVNAMTCWDDPWMVETLASSSPSMIDWMVRRVFEGGYDDIGETAETLGFARMRDLVFLERMLGENREALSKKGVSGGEADGVFHSWLALARVGALLPIRSVLSLGRFMGDGFPLHVDRIPDRFMRVLRECDREPLRADWRACASGYMDWACTGMHARTVGDFHGRDDVAWLIAAAQVMESGSARSERLQGLRKRRGWRFHNDMQGIIYLMSGRFASPDIVDRVHSILGDDPAQWVFAGQAIMETGDRQYAGITKMPSWDWVFEFITAGVRSSWDRRLMMTRLASTRARYATAEASAIDDAFGTGFFDDISTQDKQQRIDMETPTRLGFHTGSSMLGARTILRMEQGSTSSRDRRLPALMDALYHFRTSDDMREDCMRMILLEDAAWAEKHHLGVKRFDSLFGFWREQVEDRRKNLGRQDDQWRSLLITLTVVHWIMHAGLADMPDEFLLQDQYIQQNLIKQG